MNTTEKNILTASCINSVKSDGILNEFIAIESLGVQCEPKCWNCKCGTCPIGGKPYSLKEERELKMIENNLEFQGNYWLAGYPWLKDPKMLPNNFDYALKRLKNMEQRLLRDEVWMNKYSEQINDMIGRGIARKLSEEEINSYSGPVHYIAHHAVVKPDSVTTPVRIVFDSNNSFGQRAQMHI